MGARIVMDDGGGPVTGSIEVPASTLVTLSNSNDSGVAGWRWTLKDKPAGSAAALSATTTATCTITPDIEGEYMIELVTYSDAARTVFDGSDSQVVGVRFPPPLDWLPPAAGQTRQRDALLGWKVELNRILTQIRSVLASGGGLLLKFSGGFDQTPSQTYVFADTGSGLADVFVSANQGYLMPVAGTLRYLRVAIPNNSVDKDLVITVAKNGTPTAISISVPASTTGQFSNLAPEVAVAAGDIVRLQASSGTGGGLATVYATLQMVTT